MQNEYLPNFVIQVSESSSVARMREKKGEREKVNRGRERAKRDNGNNEKKRLQKRTQEGLAPILSLCSFDEILGSTSSDLGQGRSHGT